MSPYIDPVVDAAWLAARLDDELLVILDSRVLMTPDGPVADREGYLSGHIPGAVFADLPHELSDPTAELRFALPQPSVLAATLGRLGVGTGSRVVIYDSQMDTPDGPVACVWASRLWWMLRWIGLDEVSVLDGGVEAWLSHGGPTTAGVEARPPQQLTAQPRPWLLADRQQVRAAVDDPRVVLVDVLDPSHFAGQRSMYSRPGHIAGAINRPFSQLYDTAGRFLTPAALAEHAPAATAGKRAIAYCGAGIAAAAYALAMTRAGVPDVALYAASLQEWTADPNLPMEGSDGMPA